MTYKVVFNIEGFPPRLQPLLDVFTARYKECLQQMDRAGVPFNAHRAVVVTLGSMSVTGEFGDATLTLKDWGDFAFNMFKAADEVRLFSATSAEQAAEIAKNFSTKFDDFDLN